VIPTHYYNKQPCLLSFDIFILHAGRMEFIRFSIIHLNVLNYNNSFARGLPYHTIEIEHAYLRLFDSEAVDGISCKINATTSTMPSAPKKKSSARSTTTPRNNNKKDEGVESDDGIDQEGMERLMKALGEDGLDDYDRAHLVALHGTSDGEEDGGEAQEQDDEAESHSEEEESVDEVEDEDEAKSGSEIDEEDVEEAEESPAEKNAEEEEEEEEEDDEDVDVDVDDDVALDEVESVDDDAVPRQKVEINNTVRATRPDEDAAFNKRPHRLHSSGYARR
jgi:hypothetical protein